MSLKTFSLAVALVAASRLAQAQGNGADSAMQCSQAATRLRAYDQTAINSNGQANQGAGKKEERQVAAAHLLTCGAAGGAEGATTIRDSRSLTDVAVLEELVGPFRNLRDTAVLNASMTVANDPSASVPARVFALRTLWVLMSGKFWMRYEDMLPSDESSPAAPSGRCGAGIRVTDAAPFWMDGAVPPAGFETQVLALAESIRADAAQPLAVRSAATCTLRR